MRAHALGIATFSPVGDGTKVLDTAYPVVNLEENAAFAEVVASVTGLTGSGTVHLTRDHLDALRAEIAPLAASPGPHPNADLLPVLAGVLERPRGAGGALRVPVATFIADLADAPLDAHDAFLRLHLLSHRKVRPHGCNLDGVFGLLNNVVWTDQGPFDPDGFELARAALRAEGRAPMVLGLDKFPRMVDYVVPTGVRIADPGRVRLGAYLGEGTTVMHEGFVNFNAGTEGPAMVEGRISAGVFVGPATDIGGGASIMGTLSGGGKEVVRVGAHCLIGANGGLGISLGDNCVVEAGLYLTAGTRVTLPDGTVCKAARLSGRSDMLFRRNSTTGTVEMLPQSAEWGGLNADLHAN